MKLTNEKKDRSVSPVIGVILMVAVTVALVALVSLIAFNIGGQNQDDTSVAGIQLSDAEGTNVTVQFLNDRKTSELIIETVGGEQTLSQIGDSATVESFGRQVNVIGVTPEGSRTVLQTYEPRSSGGSGSNINFVEPESTTTQSGPTQKVFRTLKQAESSAEEGESVIIRSGIHTDPDTVQAKVSKNLRIGVQKNVVFKCDSENSNNVNLNLTRGPAVANGVSNIEIRGCGVGTSPVLPPELEDNFDVSLSDRTVLEGSQFTASANISDIGSSDIQSITWDFGDGAGATGNPVTHTYSGTGDYSVTVTVTSEDGNTKSATSTFTVLGSLGGTQLDPTAAFSSSPTEPKTGDEISFDAGLSSDQDGSISEYNWDFDNDGTFEKSGETATKKYVSSGEKNVRLQVVDNDGNVDEVVKAVRVFRKTGGSNGGSDGGSNDGNTGGNAGNGGSIDTAELFAFRTSDTLEGSGSTIQFYERDNINNKVGEFNTQQEDRDLAWNPMNGDIGLLTSTGVEIYQPTGRMVGSFDLSSTSVNEPELVNGQDYTVDYSPDGENILVTAENENSYPKVIIRNSTGSTFNFDLNFDQADARWSPVENKFAYANRDENVSIYKMKNDQPTKVRDNISANRRIQSLTWSPDGNKIAYAGTKGVYVYDLGSNSQVGRFDAGNRSQDIDWSPDGNKIAYTVRDNGRVTVVGPTSSDPNRNNLEEVSNPSQVQWINSTHVAYGDGESNAKVQDIQNKGRVSTLPVELGSYYDVQQSAFNYPPNPQYVSNKGIISTGENIQFDASQSSDIETVIATYEWDIDGDSDYEKTGQKIANTYTTVGAKDITLRVSDGQGNSATITKRFGVKNATTTLIAASDSKERTRIFDGDGSLLYEYSNTGDLDWGQNGDKFAAYTSSDTVVKNIAGNITQSITSDNPAELEYGAQNEYVAVISNPNSESFKVYNAADGSLVNEISLNNTGSDEQLKDAEWKPNSDELAFSREDKIVVVDPESPSSRTNITSSSKDIGDIEWKPDGSAIAYKRGTDRLVVQDIGSGTETINTTTADGRIINDIEWKPNGQEVAYIAGSNAIFGSGSYSLNSIDTGTESENLQLTDIEGQEFEWIDNSRVAIIGENADNGKRGLFEFNQTSGTSTSISEFQEDLQETSVYIP